MQVFRSVFFIGSGFVCGLLTAVFLLAVLAGAFRLLTDGDGISVSNGVRLMTMIGISLVLTGVFGKMTLTCSTRWRGAFELPAILDRTL